MIRTRTPVPPGMEWFGIVLKIDDVLTGVAAEGISNTNSQVKVSGVKKK